MRPPCPSLASRTVPGRGWVLSATHVFAGGDARFIHSATLTEQLLCAAQPCSRHQEATVNEESGRRSGLSLGQVLLREGA